MTHLYAAKGKKVVHIELTGGKPDKTAAALLLGPSGFLRAPAMRKGKSFMVGFDDDTYRKLLL